MKLKPWQLELRKRIGSPPTGGKRSKRGVPWKPKISCPEGETDADTTNVRSDQTGAKRLDNPNLRR